MVTPANFLKLRGLGFLERPRQVEKVSHAETRRLETRMETQLIRFLRLNTPSSYDSNGSKISGARIVNSNERQLTWIEGAIH